MKKMKHSGENIKEQVHYNGIFTPFWCSGEIEIYIKKDTNILQIFYNKKLQYEKKEKIEEFKYNFDEIVFNNKIKLRWKNIDENKTRNYIRSKNYIGWDIIDAKFYMIIYKENDRKYFEILDDEGNILKQVNILTDNIFYKNLENAIIFDNYILLKNEKRIIISSNIKGEIIDVNRYFMFTIDKNTIYKYEYKNGRNVLVNSYNFDFPINFWDGKYVIILKSDIYNTGVAFDLINFKIVENNNDCECY